MRTTFVFIFSQILCLKVILNFELVAHTYNPSYSGGRDQEDLCSKAAWANSSQDPILKKPFTKRAGVVAQGIGPEFKPQYLKKKEKVILKR
jgi:hypothetical protein